MRKVIDHFDIILDTFFNEPLSEDEFYLVVVQKRRKDGNFKNTSAVKRTVAFYAITSKQQLIDLKDELITLSVQNNARVYFYVNKRSFSQSNGFIKSWENDVREQKFKSLETADLNLPEKEDIRYHIYLFVIPDNSEKYLMDLDDIKIGDEKYNEIVSFIGEENVFLALPSKTGTHLVGENIDMFSFKKKYKIDVSKKWPVILYFEWDDEVNY